MLIGAAGQGKQLLQHPQDFLVPCPGIPQRLPRGPGTRAAPEPFARRFECAPMGNLARNLQDLLYILVGHLVPQGLHHRKPGVPHDVGFGDRKRAFRPVPAAQFPLSPPEPDQGGLQRPRKILLVVIPPPEDELPIPRLPQFPFQRIGSIHRFRQWRSFPSCYPSSGSVHRGSRRAKVVPFPGSLSTSTSPPHLDTVP